MKEITAQLNSYRQSPRKVRLVADAIRSQKVEEAKKRLNLIVKRASSPLAKLLDSAIANAKNSGLETNNLYVKSITVDGGKILYRRRPVWRGMAHPIRKRTAHIKLVLAEQVKSEIRSTKSETKNSPTSLKLRGTKEK